MNVIGKEYFWNNSRAEIDFISYFGTVNHKNAREVVRSVLHPWFHKRKNDISETKWLMFDSEKVREHLDFATYTGADQTCLINPEGLIGYLWYMSAQEFTRSDKIKEQVDKNVANLSVLKTNVERLRTNIISTNNALNQTKTRVQANSNTINKVNSRVNALENNIKNLTDKINEITIVLQQIKNGSISYNVPNQMTYINPPDTPNVSEAILPSPTQAALNNDWETPHSLEWDDVGLVEV